MVAKRINAGGSDATARRSTVNLHVRKQLLTLERNQYTYVHTYEYIVYVHTRMVCNGINVIQVGANSIKE